MLYDEGDEDDDAVTVYWSAVMCVCDVGSTDFDYSRHAFILPHTSSMVAQLQLIRSDLVLFVMEILMRCSHVTDKASFIRNSYLLDPLHSVTDIALLSLLRYLLNFSEFCIYMYAYTVCRKLHCVQ